MTGSSLDWRFATPVSLESLRVDIAQVAALKKFLPLSPDTWWTLKAPRKRSDGTKAWTTPPEFTAAVLAGLGIQQFDLDPASPEVPSVPCRRWFTVHDNGLIQVWNGEYVWTNPPYEFLSRWVRKAIEEHKSGRARRIVMLIPNRPGTVYWRKIVESGAAIFALDGRLHFGGAPDPAPFACALVVWGLDEAYLATLGARLPPNLRMRFE
jgi:phage N-6-adenine-methyltransferase